ncbi:MAG: hypothetical protein KDK70_20840, partial [Myxococcales bacterium]|nr:hypothetical protein [Myxococcales bacterium]
EPAADSGAEPLEGDSGEEAWDSDGSDDGDPDATKRPKTGKPKTGKPKAPKAPEGDPEELLADARQKQYKEPANAYKLARQSYTIKPSSAALWVMGPAACRLKDKSKATWVLKRLKGADKTKLKDICANKGLEI